MHGLSSENLAMVEDIHGKLFIVCYIHFAHGPTGPKSTLVQHQGAVPRLKSRKNNVEQFLVQ